MKEEIQKLLDHCVEYASELLTETGESYPFGGFIDTIGNVHPMEMEVDKKNIPSIGKVIDALSKFGDTEMEASRMHGYAVTYEAEVALDDQHKTDCIAIDIKHFEDKVPVFYLPFSRSADGAMQIGDLFAVKR